ncbi:MAG TPA: zf-HC2 domain-containing protein, partial [Paenibacillus sp.]|nr:zf-HC2 domain-containing protein [Paenibacillus sp.]
MTCEEVMELMQRHLDGDLNSEEQKRLSEHLDACEDCADMMERLQRVDEDLANLPKGTPAYSLVDGILPRLAQID